MNLSRVVLFFVLLVLVSNQFVYAITVSIPETLNVNAIVISNTVSPATPPPAPSIITNNGVPLTIEAGTDSAVFFGKSYPGSTISILKNGLVLNELPVNIDGTFEVPVRNIRPGTYTFTLVAKDGSGLKSSQLTYTIVVISGAVTEVKGIIMPPTITTDKVEVKLGDNIVFSGKSIPGSDVYLTIFAKTGISRIVTADASGSWSYIYNTQSLDYAEYTAKSRAKVGVEFTLYSEPISFTVGTSNKIRKSGGTLVNARCDLNNDGRVNLLDFSIMAFWYKRLGFPIRVDLNSDGRINLTDLSILAYCWTG
ncbi:hypothetical protein K9M47_00665 [Candidatus Gracilibacteria bacterium]|nr:hypothetical protein [Candidatus Gracilibacteria bacterium]MCF7898358.1 hypothetical protein [Candidatus Paceibacterota bacterium]